MARKPLRSQLNQIRAWVRQGRTDAWIAHQLDVSTAELREFNRRHELSAEDDADAELDLRDEIEAEIEATMAADEDEEDEEEEPDEAEEEGEAAPEAEEESAEGEGAEGAGRRRRRRRRGGRGRGRRGTAAMQAAFDHGERDGYGLWLDPAVAEDPIYAEHWAGQRDVEVTIEADQIVIKRSETAGD